MQQTDKYKLNKPGVDDPIAIAPLNENMDKVEGALAAEAEARAAETAALDQRVAALEVKKIVAGNYVGNGGTLTVDLGFAPAAVLTASLSVGPDHAFCAAGPHPNAALSLTENGFSVVHGMSHSMNSRGSNYAYIAFG